MSETAGTRTAEAVLMGWWRQNLRPEEDTGRARALRARLRRAKGALEVLAEHEVHDLAAALPWLRHRPEALVRVAQGLALVEGHSSESLARRLGQGDPPALSSLRFEKLVRCEAADLTRALRRVLPMAGDVCNVARLGRDLIDWDHPERGDDLRKRWYFDYFGASLAGAALAEEQEDDAA